MRVEPRTRLRSHCEQLSGVNPAAYSLKNGRHVSTYLAGEQFHPLNFSIVNELYLPQESRKLLLPRLIIGNYRDIRESDDPTFCGLKGWIYKNGLQDYVKVESRTGPTSYYFDNHSACVFAYAEAVSEGLLDPGFTVLQIDFHEDSAPCHYYYCEKGFKPPRDINRLSRTDFQQIVRYLKCLDIDGHNDYSLLTGLASEVVAVGQAGVFLAESICSKSIEQISGQETGNLTLSDANRIGLTGKELRRQYSEGSINAFLDRMNSSRRLAVVVDLDAFFMEISSNKIENINDETIDKIAHFIKEIAQQAGLLVVVTSPGFSHHETAVITARRIAFLMQG